MSLENHSIFILNGLEYLKTNKILCDVTLIAENKKFETHKCILASCSDYFRSMFTSGMKESSQNEIELKGVTAKGLEKVLEVIYTSKTNLEGDDIFDLIAASTHLQVIPVIKYCEKNFLNGINSKNFNDFIQTAKLYRMYNILKQIDLFIIKNLLRISTDGYLKYITYEQLINCIQNNNSELRLREIDLFNLVWKWIQETNKLNYCYDSNNNNNNNNNNQNQNESRKIIRELMKNIRFSLISPNDLVNKIQIIDEIMNDSYCRELILLALNYHVIPFSQSVQNRINNDIRSPITCILCIGGREINPNPTLHEQCYLIDFRNTQGGSSLSSSSSSSQITTANQILNKREITTLPVVLSHHQVVIMNNFLYVLGGCTTQCAHGESATQNVYRYDPRFNTWCQVASMIDKRAYFYACTLKNRIYCIAGKNRDGALSNSEYYDPLTNKWFNIQSMPSVYHAHSGAVYDNIIYITGGYSQGHFTADLQAYLPDLDQWEDLSPMNTARGWHCMCEAANRLYVFGGCHLNSSQQAQPVMQTEFYTPAFDQWTIVAPISNLHKEASCVKYLNYIYVLGGYNIQAKSGQKFISRYDYINDCWENIGQLQIGQTGIGCCVIDLPSYLVLNDNSNNNNNNNTNNQLSATTTTTTTTTATPTISNCIISQSTNDNNVNFNYININNNNFDSNDLINNNTNKQHNMIVDTKIEATTSSSI